jgi:hypothetical protein
MATGSLSRVQNDQQNRVWRSREAAEAEMNFSPCAIAQFDFY